MKAIVCNDFGPIKNIKYMDVENPEIDDESILINVRSVGVNFPDGLLVQGKYQLKPETPFIPGMEVSGEIIELGSKVVDFKIGDRVAGLSRLNGYAEKAAVKFSSVFKIPDSMSFDDSCAVLCASGTTGIAAIQIGKIMGAKVIAVASNAEKQKIAKDSGADLAIGYDNLKENCNQRKESNGIDVIFGRYTKIRSE